jgi:3-hydroxyisobutyrate dehydrogenase
MTASVTETVNEGARIAFIGLGQMGLPMASGLAEAGFAVSGYDVTKEARAALSRVPSACGVDTPEAAVESTSVLVLMLPTSAIVRAVLIDGGLLERLAPGTVIIDMGSSEPLVTRELAATASEHGIALIDAPVSGGVIGAKQGTLTIMVGGEESDIHAVKPLFDVLGGKLVHAGPVGAGHALKALNNLLSATSLLITSEAVAIGKRFGLDPTIMIDAINTSSGRSFSTELKFPRYVLTQSFDSGFGLRLMAKDMRIALNLGEALGVDAKLGARSTAVWEQAMAATAPDADHTEIARWVQDRTDRSETGDDHLVPPSARA